jgi:hypothetical protein
MISSLKENRPGTHEITVMIMGSIGRIRSFTISKRFLLWTSVFLLLYLLISLFLINRYIDIRGHYKDLSENTAKSEEEYEEMKIALATAQQHAVNLEAYIETTKEKPVAAGATDTTAASAAPAKTTASSAEKTGERSAKDVDIEGLSIKRSASGGIVIDFRLVNMTSGGVGIDGYMHILASDKENNYPQAWTAPSKDVKNGLPTDFKSGEHFFIQRFRQCHREFSPDSTSGAPAHIRVLAYDPSGNLLLNREYEVTNAS